MRLASPESKAARVRSRREHKALSRAQALGLARESFPALVKRSREPLALAGGDEVSDYLNDHEAIIKDNEGRRSIATSLLPLLARNDDGDKRPIDLSLVERDDALAPRNSLVALRLGQTAGAGFVFGNGWLSLVPELAEGARTLRQRSMARMRSIQT